MGVCAGQPAKGRAYPAVGVLANSPADAIAAGTDLDSTLRRQHPSSAAGWRARPDYNARDAPPPHSPHGGDGSGVSDTLMNVADPAPVREQVAAVASQLWESALPAHEVPHRSRFAEEPLAPSPCIRTAADLMAEMMSERKQSRSVGPI